MTSNSLLATFYPESTFGGFSDSDGTVAFYTRVNSLLQNDATIIDFGCGRGAHQDDPVAYRRHLRNLKGRVARVVGLDVDDAGTVNPTVDEFRLFTPRQPWPVGDQLVDLVLCDSVMEHLPEPTVFFREVRRILAPGGFVCIRTPNVLSYVGVASRIIPNRFHSRVLGKVQAERSARDVFPTLYRCNTVSKLRRELRLHGFRPVVYGYESEPRYLNFSPAAYALGVLHQKFAPAVLRPIIFAFGQLSR